MSEKSSVMQYLRKYGWEETEQLILTLTVVSYDLVSNYFEFRRLHWRFCFEISDERNRSYAFNTQSS